MMISLIMVSDSDTSLCVGENKYMGQSGCQLPVIWVGDVDPGNLSSQDLAFLS